MAQPPGQFMHHFFEDNTVDVLAEHVEEEPVAHLGLFDDGIDNLKQKKYFHYNSANCNTLWIHFEYIIECFWSYIVAI